MLVVGGLLLVAGLGWSIWSWAASSRTHSITDAGAVVFTEAAPALLPSLTDTPRPTPGRPTLANPAPAILPEWEPEAALTAAPAITSAPPILPSPTPEPAKMPPAGHPPTRIVAPAIDLDARVVPMGWKTVDRNGTPLSVWTVPENAAGWHQNSALPGHGSNVVLSGHHNIEGKVFRYVVDLRPGDQITLYADDTPYSYTVAEKHILKEAGMPLSVRQENAQWIMPTDGERLTLVTCWPYEWPGNTHRVIIVSLPQIPSTGEIIR